MHIALQSQYEYEHRLIVTVKYCRCTIFAMGIRSIFIAIISIVRQRFIFFYRIELSLCVE